MEQNQNALAGSHHGEPDLLERDIRLLEAYSKWVRVVRKENRQGYTSNWLPTRVDWLKSRLFWRIRSGKEPLKYAPPTCFSCPWYEVIELPEIHTVISPIKILEDEGKKFASVAQCRYEVIEEATMEGEGNAATLAFGPYRFKVWNAYKEYQLYSPLSSSPTVNKSSLNEYGNIEKTTRLTGFIRFLKEEYLYSQTDRGTYGL